MWGHLQLCITPGCNLHEGDGCTDVCSVTMSVSHIDDTRDYHKKQVRCSSLSRSFYDVQPPVGVQAIALEAILFRLSLGRHWHNAQMPRIESHKPDLPIANGSFERSTAILRKGVFELLDTALRLAICERPTKLAKGIKIVNMSMPIRLSQAVPALWNPEHFSVSLKSMVRSSEPS